MRLIGVLFLTILLSAAVWTNGLGMAGDTACYVSAGVNFAQGKGLTLYSGLPLVAYAPVLSLLVAAMEKLGLGWQWGLLLLNYFCLFLLVGLGLQIVRLIFYRSNWWQQMSAEILVWLSVPLFCMLASALSEPLFMVEFLWVVLAFANFLLRSSESADDASSVGSEGDGRTGGLRGGSGRVVILGLTVGILWLTRYSGLGIFLVVSGMLVLLPWQQTWFVRMRNTLVFVVVAGIPNVLWAYRNHLVSGEVVGKRGLTLSPVWTHMAEFGRTAWNWFLPIPEKPILNLILAVILFAIWLWLIGKDLLILSRRNSASQSPESASPSSRNEMLSPWRAELVDPESSAKAVAALRFSLLSLGFLFVWFQIGSMSIVLLDPMNTRLSAPVYLCVVVIGIHALGWIAKKMGAGSRRARGVWMASLCFLILLHPLISVFGFAARAHRSGLWFYESPEWRMSPTLQTARDFIRQSQFTNGRVFSNSPEGLFLQTGIQAFDSPERDDWHYGDRLDEALKRDSKALLVWSNLEPRDKRLRPNEFPAQIKVTTIEEFADGGIYILERAGVGADHAN